MSIKAQTLHARRRRERIRNGTWNPPAPIDAVRAHIHTLQQAGMTITGIARAANVSIKTINDALYATDRVYMYGATAAPIFALTPAPTPTPERGDHIAATGTARRIRALIAIGWTADIIGSRLGTGKTIVCRWARGATPTVTAGTATAVAAVYEQMCDTDGPSNLNRVRARQKGWVPPLGWVDVDIDDPDAQPYQDIVDEYAVELVVAGRRTLGSLSSYAEKQAAVAALAERDLDDKAIATHVQSTPAVVRLLLDDLDPAKRRRCGVCGGPVRTLHPEIRYCGADCRAEANRRKTAANARRRKQEAAA